MGDNRELTTENIEEQRKASITQCKTPEEQIDKQKIEDDDLFGRMLPWWF